jgi:hypothetical protein
VRPVTNEQQLQRLTEVCVCVCVVTNGQQLQCLTVVLYNNDDVDDDDDDDDDDCCFYENRFQAYSLHDSTAVTLEHHKRPFDKTKNTDIKSFEIATLQTCYDHQ